MDNKELAPIILFVYNRPWHTKKTLEALAENALAKESILYIYADGAKENSNIEDLRKIEDTRKIIRAEQWCNEIHIIESNTNKGLANSIIEGVTEIINRHGKVIVLEDDIITSTGFLKYMNEALNLYEEQEKVMHISGFVPVTTGADKLPETYFLRFMSCWGWGTWKRAWSEIILDIPYLYNNIPLQDDFYRFNMDGTIDMFSQIEENYKGSLNTWAIRWYSTIFLKKGFCLYPQYSMVNNIGMDGSGEHCYSPDDLYKVNIADSIKVSPTKIKENKYAYNYLKRFYKYGRDSSLMYRIKIFIKTCSFYRVYSTIRYN